MVFGGTLWLILIGLGGFLYGKLDTVSTKQDATNDKLTSMSIQMGQQNAGQQVLGIRFDALEDKVDRSLKNQDARIERLERGR